MPKVLIPTNLNNVAADLLKEAGYEVIQDADTDFNEQVAAHSDIHGLIVRSEKVTEEIIDSLPELKIIVRAGAGYNTIDIKHARRKNIDVMNTPGANSNAVAEEVIALILAAYRHLVPADKSVREGLWEKKKFMGTELTGKTIGIIGLGNIGKLLVKRLSGFEVKVLAHDPMLSETRADQLGVVLSSVEDIFANSDIISLHIPEVEDTRGMINKSLLSLAKDNLCLVNCARDGVVNKDDLRWAKEEKGLIYCNDVYPKDEAGEKEICDIAAITLPHLGASTVEANYNAARRAGEQMLDYFEKGINTYVVNRVLPPGLDAEYQELAYYLSKVAHSYVDNKTPSKIEISLYGGLDEYTKWLVGPVVQGLNARFDPLFEYAQAEKYLESKGIALTQRCADEAKGYGKSMTIDLIVGEGEDFRKVSIRGTMTEGHPMVARINGFDRMYFEPKGLSLLVQYEDKPGKLAAITSILGEHDINIIDVRSPVDAERGLALAVFKINKYVESDVLDEIAEAAIASRAVSLNIS